MASQVYGEKVQSKKPADQWLAKSIEFLMETYPAMRIAYIDNVDKDSSGKGTPMSVLLRWGPGVQHLSSLFFTCLVAVRGRAAARLLLEISLVRCIETA